MSKDDWLDPRFAADWDEAGNLLTNPDRLNQLSLLSSMLASSGAQHLLDLGIGSAQVESAISRWHADFFAQLRVTGIDASDAMLELAAQRCSAENLAGIELVRQDFRSIEKVKLSDAPDAVICVQALHEVPNDVKRDVFSWVRKQLPSNRPFYVLDRFDYPTGAWLDDWRASWNWMRAKVPEDVLEFTDYHHRYREKGDYVASVEDYQYWLDEAGFEATCPYRCFNRAMIIARAKT